MKRIFLAALSVFIIVTLIGCGSNNNDGPLPVFVTSIYSALDYDGDIQKDFSGALIDITQAVNTTSVIAGINPANSDEYRAFLDFPLADVPRNTIIESAFLDIFINRVDIQFPAETIPLRIDLFSFHSPLIESDFDFSAQFHQVKFPIFLTDFRKHVMINVTSLMVEAARPLCPPSRLRRS